MNQRHGGFNISPPFWSSFISFRFLHSVSSLGDKNFVRFILGKWWTGLFLRPAVAEIKHVMPVQLPLGKYRPVKFLVPSNTALNLLSNVGQDTSLWKRVGRVGFEHVLYSVLIAYSFRNRGLKASIEKKLQSGRRLDVYVEGKEKTGIEIELSTFNIEEKIQGIEELDRLVILVKDEQAFHDFVRYLRENPNDKVTVARVIEFLRENSIRNSAGTSGTNTPGAEST